MSNKKILPIIFIGPSLPHHRVKEILKVEVDLRGPIRRGDLDRIPEETKVIGIVDGIFHTQLAITPREIYTLLKKGVQVFGSSSMGALRAAELDVHGMYGIGEIYKMYKTGEIDSDAEVALIFDPDTLTPVSEPLVNIRYGLKIAVEQQIITKQTADLLLAKATEIYFYELNYFRLFEEVKDLIDSAELESLKKFITNNKNQIDLKQLDAILLLKKFNEMFN